ncbi:MAG: hypothetical protein COV07_00150 [Candidatus Vogelbacteria bacterium CG10_big_fil_rev_8_21_14_0_10_45_14]|uniref:Type II toxin-antitoxin system mRNA interferase toxin, RelE/StbE family n=1 Tax=Candidatus Vogelbacteria bacterium CG10_big_fil_rev_8_21_14_0_10_45_14 TaxID=1975042 RepID=A0A2H0RKX2_9BACT|nr:MAG: hypothetical protein COV07_00150 [Candidatus Vogelbacteria bacterium CG10_big_fil_rev_8_21_14_0_10_45_14]
MKLLTVGYTSSFLRAYKKLEPALKEEVKNKIDEFKDRKNHQKLDVHKLHGRFRDCYSFSVDYKNRVVFEYRDKNDVAILGVGNHNLYH